MKKNLIKGTVGLMTGIMIMSQVPAFAEEAADDSSSNASISSTPAQTVAVRVQGYASNFEELVEAGLITAKQAEEMKAFAEAQMIEYEKEFETMREAMEKGDVDMLKISSKTEHKDLFDDFVEAKIITEDEASKIKEFKQAQAKLRFETELDEKFKRYTDESILTEAEVQKSKEYLLDEDNNCMQMEAFHITMANEIDFEGSDSSDAVETVEAITIESNAINVDLETDENSMKEIHSSDGEDFAENGHMIRTTAMIGSFFTDQLVEAKIISNEQFEAMNESDIKYYQEQRDSETETILAELVSEGSITETEKKSILEYLKSKNNFVTKVEFAKVDEDLVKITEIKEGRAVSMFEELVESGAISQETADLVSKALFARH